MIYLSRYFGEQTARRKVYAPAGRSFPPTASVILVCPFGRRRRLICLLVPVCLPVSLAPEQILLPQVIAKRNHRLKHAKLRPLPDQHFLQGGSRSGAASVTEPVAVPATAALDSPAAIGRQLLSRHIAYADFDSLPDPTRFQLHQDLKGWKSSPSRLDFLYKELVRQRNAAVRLTVYGRLAGR